MTIWTSRDCTEQIPDRYHSYDNPCNCVLLPPPVQVDEKGEGARRDRCSLAANEENGPADADDDRGSNAAVRPHCNNCSSEAAVVPRAVRLDDTGDNLGSSRRGRGLLGVAMTFLRWRRFVPR